MTRRAVVTGGAGFVGSHLCEALRKGGWDVLSLDDFSAGGRPGLTGVETVEVDITDPGLGSLIVEARPQVVFHLAAISSMPDCRKDPKRCWEVNVEGTGRVVEATRRSGADKLVNVSSLAVHGVPVRGGDRSYGRSKRAAEDLVRRRASEAGLRWVNLRPANVYGPGQRGDGESAVVATWLGSIARGEPLFLDGDGRQTRDFLYVADAVDAMIRAVERADGLTLELGRGAEISLLDLLDSMGKATGWKGRVRPRPARSDDVRRSVTDPGPAQDALGWKAQTDLTAGLQNTWDWISAR